MIKGNRMKETQHSYVISIMSRDRVGIVHEVSRALSEINGNIADIRQSVLCGYFTMILLASFPEKVTARDVERKLAEIDARSDTAIDVMVKQVEEDFVPFRPSIPENAYVLTATGPDKVGFVATVSSFCVKHNINILDLSTTAHDGIYMMILVIDISQCTSIGDVRRNLQEFSQQTGLNMVLQHYDIFKAVNDIALPLH
jgi:predicted amino acid-binding ACT domain protein